ncbi:MAG: ABC transporter ATP-binding protein [Lachnospiraceae bacterium]|nr:ABC transporter ATP-binding protein [Lachnospiraceae bacterium]
MTQPTCDNKKNVSGSSILGKVLRVIGRYKLLLVLSLVLAAASVILQLYIPILFGQAVDTIVDEGHVDFTALLILLKNILSLTFLSAVAVWIMNMINNTLAFRTVRDIRRRAIRQIQVLPLSYLDAGSTGDVVQRVTADTDQLSDGLLMGLTQLFSGVVTIVVTLVFMFSKNVPVSVMVVLLTPVSFLVSKFIASRTYSLFSKQTAIRGRQTAYINEMISGAKIVKAFGHEKQAEATFDAMNDELREASEKAVFYSSLTNPSTRAVNNVIYALVALVGAFMIMGGSLTVGGLTVLLAYANQYMKPFNDISSVITELQNALACAARVFDLVEAEPEVPEAPQLLPPAEGNIKIEDMSFSYDPARPLIEDFSFEAKPGMKIAIVGPTGCGKTTFINLLMRFYDVNSGSISVDGHDIREVTRHSLRENFGMVLQESWLKNATVRDNITLGDTSFSDEAIKAAAKEAHSWEFIRRMPQGLDTLITDEALSQGQKQLLCITRVMLTLPPMLILDEATSSIDTMTELRIQNAFDKLMKGRTSFIVAHRLSTIRSADIILVMKDGHIIEQGAHDELIAKGGFYKNLYEAQFAGRE